MNRRKTRTFDTGQLKPYPWGPGWLVYPKRGGRPVARSNGMGLARNLKQGERYLELLEACTCAGRDDGRHEPGCELHGD